MTEPLAVSLASASPRRRMLLESLGLRVSVVPSNYEEQRGDEPVDPPALALRHAVGKMEAAATVGPPLLITADTIVHLDGEIFEKPADEADARHMLRALSGRAHLVHTGFAVADRRSGEKISGVETAEVRFVTLDEATIDNYIRSGEPMDKAGAYGIQGLGALLVERVAGDFYTVMGLPLVRVAAACRALGHPLL